MKGGESAEGGTSSAAQPASGWPETGGKWVQGETEGVSPCAIFGLWRK